MTDEPQRPASAGTAQPRAGAADSSDSSAASGSASARPSTARRAGAALGRAAGSALVGGREAIRRNPKANKVYRTGVGVVGGTTVALGVVMLPLPGPGALIALGGLGILGSEFEGAQEVNRRATRVVGKTAGAAKKVVDRRREARAARAAREAPAAD